MENIKKILGDGPLNMLDIGCGDGSFIDNINLLSDDMSLSEEIKIIAFKYFKSLETEGRYAERTGSAKLATLRHGWINFRYLFEYRRLLKHAIRHDEMLQPEMLQPEMLQPDTVNIEVSK